MSERKKLLKLLGKDVEYSAVFKHIKGSSAVLLNVCHNGKLLCDHVCVSAHYTLKKMENGTEIVFNATAHTYTDTKGVRKHGLEKCHNYHVKHDGYKIVKKDDAQKKARKRTR